MVISIVIFATNQMRNSMSNIKISNVGNAEKEIQGK